MRRSRPRPHPPRATFHRSASSLTVGCQEGELDPSPEVAMTDRVDAHPFLTVQEAAHQLCISRTSGLALARQWLRPRTARASPPCASGAPSTSRVHVRTVEGPRTSVRIVNAGPRHRATTDADRSPAERAHTRAPARASVPSQPHTGKGSRTCIVDADGPSERRPATSGSSQRAASGTTSVRSPRAGRTTTWAARCPVGGWATGPNISAWPARSTATTSPQCWPTVTPYRGHGWGVPRTARSPGST